MSMKNRSLLFIPAKEKTLSKLGQFGSDQYIVDLEDSISEMDKERALQETVRVLKNTNIQQVYVRLNKPRYQEEASQLASIEGLGFMLPKFEQVIEYQDLSDIWSKHPVIALIETPKGIINIDEIAKCSWIDSIAFGAEDYTATVNMENSYMKLLYQKSVLITYAKAYKKKVYDTPSFQLNNIDKMTEEIKDSVSLGFDGKLAIHPKQIEIINSSFSAYDIDYLKKVVNAYEQQEEAILVYDGKPYEKMHIARFKRIIKENGGEK